MMLFNIRKWKIGREGHLVCTKEMRKHAKILLEILQEKTQVESHMSGWDDNYTEMDLRKKCGVN
jgi:hypothetical protein